MTAPSSKTNYRKEYRRRRRWIPSLAFFISCAIVSSAVLFAATNYIESNFRAAAGIEESDPFYTAIGSILGGLIVAVIATVIFTMVSMLLSWCRRLATAEFDDQASSPTLDWSKPQEQVAPASKIAETEAIEPLIAPTIGDAPTQDFAADSSSPEVDECDSIDRFEIREQIGRGAFGVVYRAYDPNLDREVAIKVLNPHRDVTEKDAARFSREAKAAAQLQHPHIVPVYENGRSSRGEFIVSKFIHGTTLRASLQHHKNYPPQAAARLIAKIATAVHFSHCAGVIHRDLKPDNVLIDGMGEPHITDFGLARRAGGDELLTFEGDVMGTPAYMSPEQAGGKSSSADARSDLWSLGVMLYELLVGRRPFEGDLDRLLTQILRDEPIPPRKLNPLISVDLETIVEKCLAKDPHHRYDSCFQLADDLDRWLKGEPILARPISSTAKLVSWCRRNRAKSASIALAAAAVSAMTITGVVFFIYKSQTDSRIRESSNLLGENQRRLESAESSLSSTTKENYQLLYASRTKRALTHLSEGRIEQGLFDLVSAMEFLELTQENNSPDELRETKRLNSMTLAEPTARRRLESWSRAAFQLLEVHELPEANEFGREEVNPAYRFENYYDQTLAFSPDGSRLLIDFPFGPTALWSIDESRRLLEFESSLRQGTSSERTIGFSGDGSVAFVHDGSTILRWDTSTGATLGPPIVTEQISSECAMNHDGTLIATTQWSDVTIWDAVSGRRLRENGEPIKCTGGVNTLAFAPDQPLLFIGAGFDLQVWDVDSSQFIGEPFRYESFRFDRLAVSPDGEHILASALYERVVLVLKMQRLDSLRDLLNLELLQSRFTGDCPVSMVGSIELTFNPRGTPRIAFGPDGRRVALDQAELFSIPQCEPIGTRFPNSLQAVSTCFVSQDRVRIVDERGVVMNWSVVGAGPSPSLPYHQWSNVTEFALSLDGLLIATVTDDQLQLWQVANGLPVGPPVRLARPCRKLQFGEHYLVALTGDETPDSPLEMACWRVSDEGFAEKRTIEGEYFPDQVRVLDHGRKLLVTRASEHSAKVWDLEQGGPIGIGIDQDSASFDGEAWTYVAHTEDGRYLLTGTHDLNSSIGQRAFQSVQLWDLVDGRRLDQPDAIERDINYVVADPSLVLWQLFDSSRDVQGGFADSRIIRLFRTTTDSTMELENLSTEAEPIDPGTPRRVHLRIYRYDDRSPYVVWDRIPIGRQRAIVDGFDPNVLSYDGRTLAVSSHPSAIHFVDVMRRSLIGLPVAEGTATRNASLLLTPDARTLLHVEGANIFLYHVPQRLPEDVAFVRSWLEVHTGLSDRSGGNTNEDEEAQPYLMPVDQWLQRKGTLQQGVPAEEF